MKSNTKILRSLIMMFTLSALLLSLLAGPIGHPVSDSVDESISFNRLSIDAPVSIQSDENFTTSPYVSNPSALGTAEDPYIIQDLILDSTTYKAGIIINNTRKHVLISNVTISNKTVAALKLVNASNIQLENVRIYNVTGYAGIDQLIEYPGGDGNSTKGLFIDTCSNITCTYLTITRIQAGRGGTGGDSLGTGNAGRGGHGGNAYGIYINKTFTLNFTGVTILDVKGGLGGLGGYTFMSSFSAGVGGNGGEAIGIFMNCSNTIFLSDIQISSITGSSGNQGGGVIDESNPGANGGIGGNGTGLFVADIDLFFVRDFSINGVNAGTGGRGGLGGTPMPLGSALPGGNGGIGGNGGCSQGVYIVNSSSVSIAQTILTDITAGNGATGGNSGDADFGMFMDGGNGGKGGNAGNGGHAIGLLMNCGAGDVREFRDIRIEKLQAGNGGNGGNGGDGGDTDDPDSLGGMGGNGGNGGNGGDVLCLTLSQSKNITVLLVQVENATAGINGTGGSGGTGGSWPGGGMGGPGPDGIDGAPGTPGTVKGLISSNNVAINFIRNTFLVPGHYEVSGINVHYNDSYCGNYWTGYGGPDDSPRDGIGDTPYDSGNGVIDYKPLVLIPIADYDGDGLTNFEEWIPGDDGYITNAKLFDTDGDGFSDGEEAQEGTNPLDPGDHPPIQPGFLEKYWYIFLIIGGAIAVVVIFFFLKKR